MISGNFETCSVFFSFFNLDKQNEKGVDYFPALPWSLFFKSSKSEK